MASFFHSFRTFIIKHTVVTVMAIVVIAGAAGYGYGIVFPAPTVTRYVLGQVTRGTLITSVSGSGQIDAARELDIKPQVSGTLTAIDVSVGQTVKAGQRLFSIDSTDAGQSLQTAEFNLQNAQLSLQKLQETDSVNDLGDQNSVASDQVAVQSAQNDLATDYQNAYDSVSSTFLDLPSIVSSMSTLFTIGTLSDSNTAVSGNSGAQADKKIATDDFGQGFSGYNKNMSDYQTTSRTSATSTILTLLNETYVTTKYIDDSVKAGINLIDFLNYGAQQNSNALTSDRSTLASDDSKLSGDLSSMLNAQNAITDGQQSLQNAQVDLQEKQAGVAEDVQGEPIDIASAQQSIIQDQAAVTQAQQTLAEYSVTAPFDGVVAEIDANVGDDASSGTALGTIVTPDQIAQISLNEVDAANVTVGDPVTLTFSALPGVTLTGKVSDVDIVGAVSQGVVDYTIDIALDTQNSQVKPGMSVEANIITDIADDVLQVPTQAVHMSGTGQSVSSYVLVPGGGAGGADNTGSSGGANVASSTLSTALGGVSLPEAPVEMPVTVGISDNANTAITSGLTEGQYVVLSTITTTATAAAASRTGTGASSGSLTSLLSGGSTARSTATLGGAAGGFGGGGGRAAAR